MNLIERLQQVPEFRAARGQRHPLWLVLLLIILGAMMGYWGYRPLAEFVAVYGEELRGKLNLAKETKLPSYSTFRRVMQQLDFHALAAVFTDARANPYSSGVRGVVGNGWKKYQK